MSPNHGSVINNNNNSTNIKANNDKIDFDESNYQFLNITNIYRNEHFGEVFIILKQPSPLFLRVKSKMANLFFLNKKSIIHLSKNYHNIWKRLFKKSFNNMLALKKKNNRNSAKI